MSASTALALADAILVLHVAIVAFVVLGALMIAIGGLLRWRFVRSRAFRIAHLALIAFIVVQTWLGQWCPLTVWENALRRSAGATGYERGFIEVWLSRLIFFEAPMWVFGLVYSLFGAFVLACWFLVPPQARHARR